MGKLVINSYDEFAGRGSRQGGEPLQVDHRPRLSDTESAALHVGPDYRGSQHQDAGKLWHDGYAFWSASDYGLSHSFGYHPAQHPEPAWHLQGRNQVQD